MDRVFMFLSLYNNEKLPEYYIFSSLNPKMNLSNSTSSYNEETFKIFKNFNIGLALATATFCIISSSISIWTFRNIQNKSRLISYVMVVSILNCIYLFCFFFICLIRSQKKSYFLNLVDILLTKYLTSCIAILIILIDIFISVQRLFLVLNKSFMKNVSFSVSLIILVIISMIYYLPELFFSHFIDCSCQSTY